MSFALPIDRGAAGRARQRRIRDRRLNARLRAVGISPTRSGRRRPLGRQTKPRTKPTQPTGISQRLQSLSQPTSLSGISHRLQSLGLSPVSSALPISKSPSTLRRVIGGLAVKPTQVKAPTQPARPQPITVAKVISSGDEISSDVLDNFNLGIPVKMEISNFLTFESLSNGNRHEFSMALLRKLVAWEICSRGIGRGFIRTTLGEIETQGIMLKYKGIPIAFNLYQIIGGVIETVLVCAKKKQGTLRGVPIGRILMKMIDIIGDNKKVKEKQLASVPNAVQFYESLGYVDTGRRKNSLVVMSKFN